MKPTDQQKLRMEESAKGLGRAIAEGLNIAYGPRKVGFALMIYSFDGEMAWLSNGNREDLIKVLTEFRKKLIDDTADELSRPKGGG